MQVLQENYLQDLHVSCKTVFTAWEAYIPYTVHFIVALCTKIVFNIIASYNYLYWYEILAMVRKPKTIWFQKTIQLHAALKTHAQIVVLHAWMYLHSPSARTAVADCQEVSLSHKSNQIKLAMYWKTNV